MAFEKSDMNSGGVDVTNEQKERTIAALLEERRGYETRVLKATEDGDDEALAAAQSKVDGVNAELSKLGRQAKTARSSAEKRPAAKGSATRG